MNDLRSQAALVALQALLSSPHFAKQLAEGAGEDGAFDCLIHNTAVDAWEIADAFVKAKDL